MAYNESSKKLDFVVPSKSIFNHIGIAATRENVDELLSRCDLKIQLRSFMLSSTTVGVD